MLCYLVTFIRLPRSMLNADQCQSIPIKIMALIQSVSQYRSLPINAYNCQSIPINSNKFLLALRGIDRSWTALIGIDRNWSTLGSMPEFWSALGIGRGSPLLYRKTLRNISELFLHVLIIDNTLTLWQKVYQLPCLDNYQIHIAYPGSAHKSNTHIKLIPKSCLNGSFRASHKNSGCPMTPLGSG